MSIKPLELEACGKRWRFQPGTWLLENGGRVFSPHPQPLWTQLYAECGSVHEPAEVFRTVVRVQQGEAVRFPLPIRSHTSTS